jgi:hypothetical protein
VQQHLALSSLRNNLLAVCMLCLLGSAAATHLSQPAQWTTTRLCAAAVAAAVSVFGIQQLCAARAQDMIRGLR